jgi:hypothetical protein
MKQEELLKEISRLPLKQRVEIAKTILESVRNDQLQAEGRVPDKEEKLAAFKRLRGLLKFEGGPPTDEEVKDMITDYLVEKYS